MPLFDFGFQQINALPTGVEFDPGADYFPLFDNSVSYTGKALVKEGRPLEAWTLPVNSSAQNSPAASALPRTTLLWPYAFKITAIIAQLNVTQASGSAFAVDVLKNNGSTETSLIDNTTVASVALTVANGSLTNEVAPHASQTTIAEGDEIIAYCTQNGVGGAGGAITIVGYRI